MKIFPKKLFLILISPLLLGFSHIPDGATESILTEALKGEELIFHRQYDQAKALFSELAQKYPDSPLGTFGLMALYNTIMFENFDFSREEVFARVSGVNKELVVKIAKNKKSSTWDNFLCGASSGLRGFYLLRNDKAFAALGEAGTAKKCIQRALKQDPQFPDSNLGLGMYLYWRSVFTNQFRFLPFFRDQRKEGIALIQDAVDHGIIANDLSRAALMFVYFQEGKAREGLKLSEELWKKYPENVIVQNYRGRFLSSLGKYSEALDAFEALYRAHPDITVALYFKGSLLLRMGKTQQAKETLEAYLKTVPSPAWQAYAHYLLGRIALNRKDRKDAWWHFKEGYHVYHGYKPNLKMILQMRRESRD